MGRTDPPSSQDLPQLAVGIETSVRAGENLSEDAWDQNIETGQECGTGDVEDSLREQEAAYLPLNSGIDKPEGSQEPEDSGSPISGGFALGDAANEGLNCEGHCGVPSPKCEEEGIRACVEDLVAPLDRNTEEKRNAGIDLNELLAASAVNDGKLEVSEDYVSTPSDLRQGEEGSVEGQNRSEKPHEEADFSSAHLKLNNEKAKVIDGSEFPHASATEHFHHGIQNLIALQTSTHSESFDDGLTTNNSQTTEKDLPNDTDPLSMSFESAAVPNCQLKQGLLSSSATDLISSQTNKIDVIFDAEEMVECELKKANPSNLPPGQLVYADLSKNLVVGSKSEAEKVAEEETKHIGQKHDPKGNSAAQEAPSFCVGDLVWAKVKSHPWWPGQIFDPSDASAFAKSVQKSDRALVAFFGDGTFGWLQQSQLMRFQPNFEKKVKQTTMKLFSKAVAEALEEVCRRSELGSSCSCHERLSYSTGTFPDVNTGIQKGVRIKCHKDISMSKEMLEPEKILKFVKDVACSPFGSWSSSIEASELRGYAYGFRTCMFDTRRSNADDLLQNVLAKSQTRAGQEALTPSQSARLKRRLSSCETYSEVAAETVKAAKKVNMGKDGILKGPLPEGGDQLATLKTMERGKGKRVADTKDFPGSKKARRSHQLESEAVYSDETIGKDAQEVKGSDGDAETLFSLTGFDPKLQKKLLRKGNLRAGIDKNVTNRNSGTNLRKPSELRTKFRNDLNVSAIDYAEICNDSMLSPTSKKSFDTALIVKHKDKLLKLEKFPVSVLDPKNKQNETVKGWKRYSNLHSQQGNDVNKSTKAIRVGECIQRIAGELTGTPPIAKCVDQSSTRKAVSNVFTKPGLNNEKKVSAFEPAALPRNQQLQSTESVDEKAIHTFVRLLQGLLFVARDPLNNSSSTKSLNRVRAVFLKFRDTVFQKSSGYAATVPMSDEQRIRKRDARLRHHGHLNDLKTRVPKLQPHLQDVAPLSQKDGLKKLAQEARKRKSEVLQEGLRKKPKRGLVTSVLQGQHAFQAGMSACKSANDNNSGKHYSRKLSSPALDAKTPIQQPDDRLSSLAPAGLFMKFPESFALPSEAQLKATFIRFGALQTAGTRVYRNTASARVIFKRGNDAEKALNYAQKNGIFGKTKVSFRLRHFQYLQRTDSKQNLLTSRKENLSVNPGRRTSMSSMGTLEGHDHLANPLSSARIERRRISSSPDSQALQAIGNNNPGMVLNIGPFIPNAASTVNESSGDIQDQMIKLLRQVSVIVGSPVTEGAT